MRSDSLGKRGCSGGCKFNSPIAAYRRLRPFFLQGPSRSPPSQSSYMAIALEQRADTIRLMTVPWERIPIFAGLKSAGLEFLPSPALEVNAPSGKIIINENEPGNKMFIIRSGEVRVWKGKRDGTQVELNRLRSGDFFGEMCILETPARRLCGNGYGQRLLDFVRY